MIGFMANVERNHNRLRAWLAWPFFALLLAGGCGDNSKSASSEDESERIAFREKARLPGVLAVGSETLTYDEVAQMPVELSETAIPLIDYLKQLAQISDLEQFRKLAKPKFEEALTGKMKDMLLYQQARKQIGEDADEALEKAIDSEWRRWVLRFEGDDAKAEEALRQMGMNRQSFRQQRKRLIVRQSYLASKLPGRRPITRRELVKCYDEMKEEFFVTPAMLRFRLIDIQPTKLEVTGVYQDRLGRAKKLAKELVKRIREGEDFGELAKQFSHGHRSIFGGLWDTVRPESLAEPYDILAAEAEKIGLGQMSQPIEVQGHIFIMKLEEKRSKGYEPLENVQELVERKIITDRQKQAIDRLNDELMQQVALSERDKFIDFCLEKIYQMSTQ